MKNALITGASRGIGAACAEKFASEGYRVFVNYNNSEDEAIALCEKTGAIPLKFDVSNPVEVKAAADFIHENYGLLSVLVNNAGIAEQKLFTDVSESDWDRMFSVNVKGAYLATREFVSDMIHNKYGKIINVSSMWGIAGASCEVHYSASKAALIGFTKALAKELGPSNINVNCIAPGVIDTDMNARLDEDARRALIDETPLCRFGTAPEIADVVMFLASDKSSFITGAVLTADGGFAM